VTRTKIGLALGGGARGLAHVGVLQVLEMVPVPAARKMGAQIVIAVDVGMDWRRRLGP